MGKILYLECNSGISGDMTVGALLDLGADRRVLEQALLGLGVGGYHLHFGRTVKCGLDAYDFDVHLEEMEEEGHEEEIHSHVHSHEGEAHSHVHEHEGDMQGHGHSHEEGPHSHVHGHEGDMHGHDQVHEHGLKESHFHDHAHSHSHSHDHTHPHVHRNLADIYEIIDRLDSGEAVKALARKMFLIVAEAEAKAHGLPIEEVHFHEVGAIDSIVDIISVAVCLDNLGISEVVVSPLAEGCGQIRCQHGVIPVPVPATANIAAAHGLQLRLTDQQGEMVTPTGAAIAAALRTREKLPSSCRIVKTGMGAGKKDFDHANVLRAMILETTGGEGGQMWVLESNIDDCGGEMLGFVMEKLLEAGAADVWNTPIYMKKNRPAYMVSVLCREQEIERMEEIILTESTTIGIRRYPVSRTVMDRRKAEVETRFGRAEVKICSGNGKTFCYPEYESVRALCRESGADFQSVYYEIRRAAEETCVD